MAPTLLVELPETGLQYLLTALAAHLNTLAANYGDVSSVVAGPNCLVFQTARGPVVGNIEEEKDIFVIHLPERGTSIEVSKVTLLGTPN